MISSYKLNKFLSHLIPNGFQIRRLTIMSLTRLLFFTSSFISYWTLVENIPEDISFRYEIAMIGCITFSVLVLLPIFDRFTHTLKSYFLSEYLSDDSSVSRIAYKRFDMNSLIKSVFPDMVKISGSDSGRLGILTEKGNFEIFNYNRGRQKKIQTRYENSTMSQLIQFLLEKKQGVSIIETTEIPHINQDFVALRCDYILPLVFREKIFGFVAFSSIPGVDSFLNLNFLSRQCALVIHNHILSSQIVENTKYRQEEESAARIQNSIQYSTPPDIEGLSIEYSKKSPQLFIEFFQISDNSWFFLILNAGGGIRPAGLVNSYLAGNLYSRISRKKSESFVEIKEIIHQIFRKAEWKEKYSYILGKINPLLNMEILQEGSGFRITSLVQPQLSLVSLGWKNLIERDKLPLIVEFRGDEILRFAGK